jgi:hypothetical protein
MKSFKIIGTIAFIALLIQGCARPQSSLSYSNNLLQNAGFEYISDGKIQDWITDSATVRQSDPKPYRGKNYLIGSMGQKITHTYQVINLLQAGYTTIDLDSGSILIKYGGYQSGWKKQKDYGIIEVVCLDKNHKEIAYSRTKGFYSNHTWVRRHALMWLPKRTRYIKYTFIATRVEGTNNDAYLDDAFIYIGKKDV